MTDYTWNASKDHPTHAALAGVLEEAFAQSATGKGQERHGNGDKLESQPIMLLPHLLDSVDGLSYQVMKKIQEATKMFKAGKVDAAEREFLGAIVYSACGILFMRSRKPEEPADAADPDPTGGISREPNRWWRNRAVEPVEEPKPEHQPTSPLDPEFLKTLPGLDPVWRREHYPTKEEKIIDELAASHPGVVKTDAELWAEFDKQVGDMTDQYMGRVPRSIADIIKTNTPRESEKVAKAHGATTAEEVREYWNLRHEWRSWLPSGHTYKPGITLAELRTFHDRYARDDAGPDSVRAYIAGFAVPKDD